MMAFRIRSPRRVIASLPGTGASALSQFDSPRSLRRAYLEWVDEQIEAYKDSVPRAELIDLAQQVVEELDVTEGGQYQLTELLLCTAVDRKIFRMLKLPGYRSWRLTSTTPDWTPRADPAPGGG